MVTSKVRIINDFSFDPNTARGTKYGLNRDSLTQDISRCFFGEALPKLLAEIVRLRIKYPLKRILVSKAGVSNAFRNVRITPEYANKFCYVLDDLIVADLRLTFGWAESPGFGGLLLSAAEHAPCNTSVRDAHILSEGGDMMSHVTVVERGEKERQREYHTIPRPDPPREGSCWTRFLQLSTLTTSEYSRIPRAKQH